jgi:hypothetical protein
MATLERHSQSGVVDAQQQEGARPAAGRDAVLAVKEDW